MQPLRGAGHAAHPLPGHAVHVEAAAPAAPAAAAAAGERGRVVLVQGGGAQRHLCAGDRVPVVVEHSACDVDAAVERDRQVRRGRVAPHLDLDRLVAGVVVGFDDDLVDAFLEPVGEESSARVLLLCVFSSLAAVAAAAPATLAAAASAPATAVAAAAPELAGELVPDAPHLPHQVATPVLRQVGVAHLGEQVVEVELGLVGVRQAPEAPRLDPVAGQWDAVGRLHEARDAEAVLQGDVDRATGLRVDLVCFVGQEALGSDLDLQQAAGQVLHEEAALLVGLRAVVASTEEAGHVAEAAAAAPPAALLAAATLLRGGVLALRGAQADAGLGDGLALGVPHDAGDFVAGAERDVGDLDRRVLGDVEGLRAARRVHLGQHRHREAALGHVGVLVEAVGVGLRRREQLRAVALPAQAVAEVGLHRHLGAHDGVAGEVGDATADEASRLQLQVAERDLDVGSTRSADVADVLLEQADGVQLALDLQRDAQVAVGLALEREQALFVGDDRLRDAP